MRNGLGECRHVEIVRRLLGVVVLFGHDAGFQERLGAIPVELFLLQVGLRVFHVGLGGFFRRNIGVNVGFGGGDGGLLGVDRGLLLHVLDGGQSLALLHEVAFLDIEVRNAAEGRGPHIHVGLGFDLAGAADHGGQILARHGRGVHLGVSRLLLDDHKGYKPGGHQHSERNEEDFFHSDPNLGFSPI